MQQYGYGRVLLTRTFFFLWLNQFSMGLFTALTYLVSNMSPRSSAKTNAQYKHHNAVKTTVTDSTYFLSVPLPIFVFRAEVFNSLILFSVWLVDFRDLGRLTRYDFAVGFFFSYETWSHLLHTCTHCCRAVCVSFAIFTDAVLWDWLVEIISVTVSQHFLLKLLIFVFLSTVCAYLHAWTLPVLF